MWILFALLSAVLLGFYDVFKKISLKENAVIPILFMNTIFCSIIFLPLIILSFKKLIEPSQIAYIPVYNYTKHIYVIIKALLVLGSWIFGYFAIKYLPLTIVGPINAMRPILTLLGALLLFQEQLNIYQWIGVILAILSFYLLSRTGKKEGIKFMANKWILFLLLAALLGTASGLYDKYLISNVGLNKLFVQGWYNIYQMLLMLGVFFFIWYPYRKKTIRFEWRWSILFISLFLTAADVSYFYALSIPGAMISIVSMMRRSSVIVSFLCGAFLFKEKNIRSKAFDLFLVLLSVICLLIGSLP